MESKNIKNKLSNYKPTQKPQSRSSSSRMNETKSVEFFIVANASTALFFRDDAGF
jgi:hypothetical protein